MLPYKFRLFLELDDGWACGFHCSLSELLDLLTNKCDAFKLMILIYKSVQFGSKKLPHGASKIPGQCKVSLANTGQEFGPGGWRPQQHLWKLP